MLFACAHVYYPRPIPSSQILATPHLPADTISKKKSNLLSSIVYYSQHMFWKNVYDMQYLCIYLNIPESKHFLLWIPFIFLPRELTNLEGTVGEKLGQRHREHLDVSKLKLAPAGNNEPLRALIRNLEIKLTYCNAFFSLLHVFHCAESVVSLSLRPCLQKPALFLFWSISMLFKRQ